MKIDPSIIERLTQVKWLSNCGRPLNNNLNLNISYVSDWEDAKKYHLSSTWENTTLVARNALTMYLHKKYSNRYDNWNKLVREAKALLEEQVFPTIENLSQEHSLDEKWVGLVKWDILNAVMEHAYRDCKNRPTFFLDLLEVYEEGNFPCGWQGDWPEGDLLVF